jgi:hypothetical protein
MTEKFNTNRILVSGTGKMGKPLLSGINQDDRYILLPWAISDDKEVIQLGLKKITPIQLAERSYMLSGIREEVGPFVLVDAVPAVASQGNAEFYSQFDSLPVIMMSTGVTDLTKICNTLVLPNACLQLIAWEKFIAGLEDNLFVDECYSLDIEESHQKTKPDVSGTARKMVPNFNRLGFKFEEKQIVPFRGEEHYLRLGIPFDFHAAHGYHKYTISSTLVEDMRLRILFSKAEDYFMGNILFNNLGYYQEIYGKASSEYNDKTLLWGSQFVDMLGYRTFEFGIHISESKNNTKVAIFHTILGHEPYVKGVLNNALPFMQEKCQNGLTGENFTSLQLYDWVMNR